MDKTELKRVLLTGVVLGVAAGLVVWWLERFEVGRLRSELGAELDTYLRNHAEFDEFLRGRGGDAP